MTMNLIKQLTLLVTAVVLGREVGSQQTDLRLFEISTMQQGLTVFANTTGFALNVYRKLPVPETTTTTTTTTTTSTLTPSTPTAPTPGSDSTPMSSSTLTTPTTTAMPKPSSTTPTPKIAVSGFVNVSVVALRELTNNTESLKVANHNVDSASLRALNYIYTAQYAASLKTGGSTDAAAMCVQFISTVLAPSAKLNFTVCQVYSNATFISGTGNNLESMEVRPGQVWMQVKVMDWPWCQPCQNGTASEKGEFLDVDVEIELSPGRKVSYKTPASGKPSRFELETDAYYDVSNLVTLNDLPFATMPSLKSTPKNNYATLTLRLPRFDTSGSFLQIIEPGYKEGPKSGDGTVGGAWRSANPFFGLIGYLVVTMLALILFY